MASEASAVFCGRASEAFDLWIFPSHMSERDLFIHLKDFVFMVYGCTVPMSAALIHSCLLTCIQETITSPKSQHIVCDTWMVYTRSIYETLM